MPSIITPSRHNPQQMNLPSSSYSTPGRLSRALSPPASVSSYSTPTITPLGTQQKLNVVNRVAIEGKAKQNEDSVFIRMYLKMSLPLDSVSPGSTVQLFPEENVKILSSQVHPLDSNFVPYNFDSTVSPLLHRAARALKLPERSKQTFQSTFNLASAESSTVVDATFTGHILVSNYYISYVLPKHFPLEAGSAFSRRRSPISERNQVHFMAAIDMVVPYVSRPPRAPYLLSIPTPRCLQNYINLRIFPPSTPNISSSFASLSSTDNDESGSWDLASEPHVTRSTSSRSRSNSYNNNFADDESSDSSTVGFPYGCGISGTFPSAERIRVRWAKPIRSFDTIDSSDGRRRVGVKDVKGEMTCIIRGQADDGVLMEVSYKGTCKGVWFPGVATMLGMDVGLIAKNSGVTWAEGSPNEWQVNGGTGYTGFDVGSNQKLSRHDSFESNAGNPNINILPSTPNGEIKFPRASGLASRQDSTSSTSTSSSTSSLLRAPLPTQNVADYSFEGSPTASGILSSHGTESLSSLPASVSNLTSQSQSCIDRGPEHPVTLHLNMNELLPASRNNFIFSISGTIVVTPRPPHPRLNGNSAVHSGSEGEGDSDESRTVTLPKFTVHAADSESISFIVKNDSPDGEIVEVYNDSMSSSSVKGRPTQLNKGAISKSSSDSGLRIALKRIPFPVAANGTPVNKQRTDETSLRAPARPLTPSGSIGSRSSSPINGLINNRVPRTSLTSLGKLPSGTTVTARPVRDGPLMIPWVDATVTPLLPSTSEGLPESYAVRLSLPAPADMISEWLEFGLAKPGISAGSKDADRRPPRIDLVNVSVAGVPVRFDTTAATAPTASQELDLVDLGGVKFGEMSSKEWISWIRVRVGGAGGSIVVVDYVVRTEDDTKGKAGGKGKKKARDEVPMNIYLPSFSLPVGRLEVVVEDAPGLKLSSMRTNLHHSSSPTTKRRLLHYSTEEFFYPHLSFFVRLNPSQDSSPFSAYLSLLYTILVLVGLLSVFQIRWQVYSLGKSLEGYPLIVESGWNEIPQTVTVTTTLSSYEDMKSSSKGPSSIVSETKPAVSMPTAISGILPLNTVSPTSTLSLAPPNIPARSKGSSSSSSQSSSSHPSSITSSKETYALITMQSLWEFQWQDLKPLVESTAQSLKQTLGPVWKILELVWWGPD